MAAGSGWSGGGGAATVAEVGLEPALEEQPFHLHKERQPLPIGGPALLVAERIGPESGPSAPSDSLGH